MCLRGLPAIAFLLLFTLAYLFPGSALLACLLFLMVCGGLSGCYLALSLAFFGLLSDASSDCLCTLHASLSFEVLSWLSGGTTNLVCCGQKFSLLSPSSTLLLLPASCHEPCFSLTIRCTWPLLTGCNGWPARAGHIFLLYLIALLTPAPFYPYHYLITTNCSQAGFLFTCQVNRYSCYFLLTTTSQAGSPMTC